MAHLDAKRDPFDIHFSLEGKWQCVSEYSTPQLYSMLPKKFTFFWSYLAYSKDLHSWGVKRGWDIATRAQDSSKKILLTTLQFILLNASQTQSGNPHTSQWVHLNCDPPGPWALTVNFNPFPPLPLYMARSWHMLLWVVKAMLAEGCRIGRKLANEHFRALV